MIPAVRTTGMAGLSRFLSLAEGGMYMRDLYNFQGSKTLPDGPSPSAARIKISRSNVPVLKD